MMARLEERYKTELKSALADELGLTNPMAVPRLEKVVVSMAVGFGLKGVFGVEI